MSKEDYWVVIIFMLHELEIYAPLENFLKENNLIGSESKVSNMTYEEIKASIELFLEDSSLQIEDEKKTELLKFCNM